jgi:excisionase family DNA binding protein
MSDNTVNRPVVAVLPGGGVYVAGEGCALLSEVLSAGIRALTRPARGGMPVPPPPALVELATAVQAAAIEHAAARHRDLARLAAEKAAIAGDLAPLSGGAPLGDGEIGVTQAARILGVSPQRVRQLTATGRIPARMAGSQWAIRRVDVEAYQEWRGDGGNGRDGNGQPRREAG